MDLILTIDGELIMNRCNKLSLIIFELIVLLSTCVLFAQRKMENLGRGLVALRISQTQVFLSWRMLGTDPIDISFNLYRESKLITATTATNFIDTHTENESYSIRTVINGEEQDTSAYIGVETDNYISIPLYPIGDYYVHFVWVGDLDGDGEYDFIVDRNPNEDGNSSKLDAYRRDGLFLWRIDTGPNGVNRDNLYPGSAAISNGHSDGVTVYDLNSDGRAEVILKTANGVVFGDGTTLVHHNDDDQFISVINGITGAEEARAPVPNDYIADGPLHGHFGIMYCDGVNPTFVFKAKNRRPDDAFNLLVVTYDYTDGELTQRWLWKREEQNAPDFHQIRIADIDSDGRDELCDGGYALDDNGTFLYAIPGVIHGDRFHITDFDPDRSGLEGYCIQQDNPSGLAWVYYDASDGSIIKQQTLPEPVDLARGTAGDIDPRYKGVEFWTFTDGIYTPQSDTAVSSSYPWPNFKIWWDGDLSAELLNRERISKWIPESQSELRLLTASDFGAVDSWRDAAQFHGDIIGDWREEVIFENENHNEIMIFTTTIPTTERLYTLPHNPGYRTCMTVKGYLQSNLVDYYLGTEMETPPPPSIVLVDKNPVTYEEIPPYRPQNLVASTQHDTVLLNWIENQEPDLAGYILYRSQISQGPYTKINASLILDNSYIDTAVVYDTTYFYVLTAVDTDSNESPQSNEVIATPSLRPAPPIGLTAVAVPDSVTLTWWKNSEPNITGYNIYRSRTSGQSYSKLNSELVVDTTYTDHTVENEIMYFYIITSFNDLGLESLYSNEVYGTPGYQVVLQAEDANYSGGCSNDSDHDNFFGSGFINFPSNGGIVEFQNVDGGQDGGNFVIAYRYALNNNPRTGIFKVNDESQNITMQNTGDWSNWRTDSIAVYLNSGPTNTILFQSTGQDFGNLDQITVIPSKPAGVEWTAHYDVIPDNYQLYQNFPNPFNPETVIRYDLPKAGFVTIRVIDILGRTVKVLLNEVQKAGHRRITWDGKNESNKTVSSGIYFYELATDSYRRVKKMILVR
jgi:hypothetical protein